MYEDINKEVMSNETFAFVVHSQYKKLKREEQTLKINTLELPKIRGKCNLKKPDRVFILAELYDYNSKELIKVFFGKDLFAIQRKIPFHTKYGLPDRLMLGPTSTDHNLAFLMANMGHVDSSKTVIDPFLGTASILIACSHFGSMCFGSEIGSLNNLNRY